MDACSSSAVGRTWSSSRTTGEAPLRYTDIGGGPSGMTVVYLLNEDNKKERPEDLIQIFKVRHGG